MIITSGLLNLTFLSILVGFNINFENAPFKLTREYVELMGGAGEDSRTYTRRRNTL